MLSSDVKYMVEDLYHLPIKLLLCESIDRTDSLYLNLSRYLIINTLDKILNNNKSCSLTSSNNPPKFNHSNKTLAYPEYSGISDSDYPSMKVFHYYTCTTSTTSVQIASQSVTMIYVTSLELYTHIKLCGNLFFIQYIPDNTI